MDANLRKLYRYLYLKKSSVFANPKLGFLNKHEGTEINLPNLGRLRDRLNHVEIKNNDFKKTIKSNDGASTFFYLDPYFGTSWLEENDLTLDSFIKLLKTIKGKFIMSWQAKDKAKFTPHFHVISVKDRPLRHMSTGKLRTPIELLISNFTMAINPDMQLASSQDAKLHEIKSGRMVYLKDVMPYFREFYLAIEDTETYAELRTLVEHTKDELERAGLFDEDSDYGGMLADSVLAIMKVFAKQGHSGFSAQMCRELFHRLSNFETLTPITSDPEEWQDISEIAGGEKGQMWQNKRNPAIFSDDGGKTWYDVNEKDKDGA